MDERPRLVEFALAPEQVARLAAASRALRPTVPGIAREAAEQIRRDLPQYVRPHDRRYGETLEVMVELLIGHFVELMGDPDRPSDDVLAFAREVGAGEAREGRSMESWQAAIRIGAGVAIARLTDHAERLELGAHVSEIGQIAQAVFAYTDRIAEAVSVGHTEVEAQAAGELEGHRQRLLHLLLEPEAPVVALAELAHKADWRIPETLAAVALRPPESARPHRPAPPPDALLGLHLDAPVVIMPDPDGPGRRHQLEIGLRDWVAAVGPTVQVTDTAKSLRWARQALELADTGIIPDDKLIAAVDHMPLVVMLQERELVELIASRRLAVFDGRPSLREDLTRTLLALIEHRFNSTTVAARLHVHPQTVRYRLRKLEQLLGPDLYDPRHQLELHMVLHARRAGLCAAE